MSGWKIIVKILLLSVCFSCVKFYVVPISEAVLYSNIIAKYIYIYITGDPGVVHPTVWQILSGNGCLY